MVVEEGCIRDVMHSTQPTFAWSLYFISVLLKKDPVDIMHMHRAIMRLYIHIE